MPKLFLFTIVLFFVVNPASAQQSNHRDIYLFSADAGNASFIAQKAVLTDAAGLKERDLVVHDVVGRSANQSVFKKYKASENGFTFILIGKDGGEKLRSRQPVSLEKLYRTIDAMPMRKDEMKHKL